ncbi:MAG: sulfurtransferase TusA family protein [Cyanobacteria bacterium]|nr:sulfurtransferase TusA family protein [Cyanobacteriota bacterium]
MKLDLRTTKCPLNFVKTRLALEKIQVGQVLEVWIQEDGESALNIPKSIAQEGHQVIEMSLLDGAAEKASGQRLKIRKCG